MSVVDSSSVWYTDQLITTHGLLASRVCSAPRTSGLWRLPGLAYNETFSDAALCWHGRGYKDCNKDIHIVYQVEFQTKVEGKHEGSQSQITPLLGPSPG